MQIDVYGNVQAILVKKYIQNVERYLGFINLCLYTTMHSCIRRPGFPAGSFVASISSMVIPYKQVVTFAQITGHRLAHQTVKILANMQGYRRTCSVIHAHT